MQDSWIDKEEFEELVGEFVKKRRKDGSSGTQKREAAPDENPSDENPSDEAPDGESEIVEEQEPPAEMAAELESSSEIEEESPVRMEDASELAEVEEAEGAEDLENAGSEAAPQTFFELDESDEPPASEDRGDEATADTQPIFFVDDEDAPEAAGSTAEEASQSPNRLPGLAISSPLLGESLIRPGEDERDDSAEIPESEEPTIVESGVGDEPGIEAKVNLDGVEGEETITEDSIFDREIDSGGEASGESPEEADQIPQPKARVERVTRFEIDDPASEEELEERRPQFLGEAAELLEQRRPMSPEAEAARAVESLAEARDRARSSDLLKRLDVEKRSPAKDTSEPAPTEDSLDEPVEEFHEVDDSEAELDLVLDVTGPLRSRLENFATLAREHHPEARVSIADRDGNFLYRDATSPQREGEEAALILSLLEAGGILEGVERNSCNIQTRDGTRLWHSVFSGSGDSSRLLAHFQHSEPLAIADVPKWAKKLAEAADPANAGG